MNIKDSYFVEHVYNIIHLSNADNKTYEYKVLSSGKPDLQKSIFSFFTSTIVSPFKTLKNNVTQIIHERKQCKLNCFYCILSVENMWWKYKFSEFPSEDFF